MNDFVTKKYYETDKGEVGTFEVYYDDESPREMYDNAGRLYIEWGRTKDHYGDDFNGKNLCQIVYEYAKKYSNLTDQELMETSFVDMIKHMNAHCPDKIAIFPVYGYEHSGFTVSMGNGYPYNDRFDGGTAGFIFVTKERCEEMGADFQKAKEIAEAEVKEFDMYLQNEVYVVVTSEESIGGCFSDKYGDDLVKDLAGMVGLESKEFYDSLEELESSAKELE